MDCLHLVYTHFSIFCLADFFGTLQIAVKAIPAPIPHAYTWSTQNGLNPCCWRFLGSTKQKKGGSIKPPPPVDVTLPQNILKSMDFFRRIRYIRKKAQPRRFA